MARAGQAEGHDCWGSGRGCRGGGATWGGGAAFTTEWSEGTVEGHAGRERRKNGPIKACGSRCLKGRRLVDSSTTDLHKQVHVNWRRETKLGRGHSARQCGSIQAANACAAPHRPPLSLRSGSSDGRRVEEMDAKRGCLSQVCLPSPPTPGSKRTDTVISTRRVADSSSKRLAQEGEQCSHLQTAGDEGLAGGDDVFDLVDLVEFRAVGESERPDWHLAHWLQKPKRAGGGGKASSVRSDHDHFWSGQGAGAHTITSWLRASL